MAATEMAIVVPVYNDPDGIRLTLESLLVQTSPHAQTVVVDNHSTDTTSDVVHSFEMERLRLLNEDTIQSSYAARNTGIQNTNAEILAFIDADVSVPNDWVESILAAFRSTDAAYMGTSVELLTPDNPSLPARFDHHTGFPVEQYLEHQYFTPTCCLAVRRDVFEEVGLFDPRLTSGGDKEFGNRVHDAGYDMHYAENITVYHPTRNSVSDLVAKDLRVGRGLCQLQRYHPDRYGSPGIPPRPSGAKSPRTTISRTDRLTFRALGTMLTGVRALGYYRELVAPTPVPDIDDIPTLD